MRSMHPLASMAVAVILTGACATSGRAFETRSARLSTGVTLRYVEAGDPDGAPVVFLHGFTDTSRSFLQTMQALVASHSGLRLFALDARGHGGSSMPEEAGCASAPERCFEFADFAADVIAFMDHARLGRAHVVGHSMGSATAQELALSHPDRLLSLVLIASFASGLDNPVFHGFLKADTIEGAWKSALVRRSGFRWPEDAYNLTPLDADPGVESWNARNWVVDPVADPELIDAVNPETAHTRLGTWIGTIRNLAAVDNRDRLTRLTVPTLVIWATQDNVFLDQPDQARLRASLDTAASACRTSYLFKTYGKRPLPASGQQEDDLGHNVQWGAPEAVAADIAAFIETGRPTADLPYADPNDVRRVRIERGGARIEGSNGCATPRWRDGRLDARLPPKEAS